MHSLKIFLTLGLLAVSTADFLGGFSAEQEYGGDYGAGHAVGGNLEGYVTGHDEDDGHSHPQYSFEYAVHDPLTGDEKSHHEERYGDFVKGFYTLKEADGSTRHVKYTADKHNGFNAEVIKLQPLSHAVHAELPIVVGSGEVVKHEALVH